MKVGFRKKGKGLEYRFSYDGKQYSCSGATEKECREKSRAIIDKLVQGIKIDARSVTVAQFYAEWMKSRTNIKPSTAFSCSVFFNSILPVIGDMKVIDVDARDIERVKAYMLPKMSDSTINTRLGALRSLFKYAVEVRIIPFSPCNAVKDVHRHERQPEHGPEVRKSVGMPGKDRKGGKIRQVGH